MSKCKVCHSENVEVVYAGKMRIGKAKYLEKCKVYRCKECYHVYHNEFEVDCSYYESVQYRNEVDETAEVQEFYKMFDETTLMKLEWTGTARFRDKIVMDVGCAGGMFLDYVKGIAKKTIAVEPSETFRAELEKKHTTYPYVHDVIKEKMSFIDVVCSFDVIEHVEDVNLFVKDIYGSLKNGGEVIIGTPTIAEAYQEVLGDNWNKFNFRTQHVSVFTKESLRYLFEKHGFSEIVIKNVQRYGLGNLLAWSLYKEPKGNMNFSWISETLDTAFKNEIAAKGMGDYLIVYAKK